MVRNRCWYKAGCSTLRAAKSIETFGNCYEGIKNRYCSKHPSDCPTYKQNEEQDEYVESLMPKGN